VNLNAAGIAAVQSWVDNPSANRGLIIANASVTDGADFDSSEAATAGNRPRLTIQYVPGSEPTATSTSTATPTATPTASATPTATLTPATIPMHAGDLDGTKQATSASKWSATVTITVHGASDAAVPGAAVTGRWSNGATGTATCTTGAGGACSVSKTGLSRSKTPSVTFNVTGISKTGYSYQSIANHDQDGDSDGTQITVARP
jgi:hypothetical protein